MRKTDLNDIRAVLHRIRTARYPDVDEAVLDAILEVEAGAIEDDAYAIREIRRVVEAALGVEQN